LSLPDATEEPHFHYTSFRINGKIFATMPPSNDILHVFAPEEDREVAIAAHPEACETLHWGKKVVGVKIDLKTARREFVQDLLRAAYDSKSKKRSA
jgi:YjbR